MAEPLPTIEVDRLDDVTGAAAPSSDTQLTAALQGIMSSLKSIGAQNNTAGGSSISQLLPLLLMARGGGGACPCGCGMANCARR
jgi:hypothetical protein